MAVGTRASKPSKKATARPRNPPKAPKAPKAAPRNPARRPRHQGRFVSTRSSPATLSPDEVLETEVEVPESDTEARVLYPSLADFQRRLARLESEKTNPLLGHRVFDQVQRPQAVLQTTQRAEESIETSAKPDGPGERVSFLHINGEYPSVIIHRRYRSVDPKYFKQILFGTFIAENVTKLGHGLKNRSTSDSFEDPRGIAHILQCLEVYGQTICFYAHPSVGFELANAISEYRFRLAEYSWLYTFESVKDYNTAFLTARILEGQDNPLAWRADDSRCTILLRQKPYKKGCRYSVPQAVSLERWPHESIKGGTKSPNIATPGYRRWNRGLARGKTASTMDSLF